MDIYEKIKEDHVKLKSLMNDIAESGDDESQRREELFMQFKEELISHARSEEQTLYSALNQHKETEDDAEHGTEEHIEADELLSELANANDFGGHNWLTRFKELKQALEHHIKEEEGEIFDDAREVLSDEEAQNLGEKMDTLEETIKEKLQDVA